MQTEDFVKVGFLMGVQQLQKEARMKSELWGAILSNLVPLANPVGALTALFRSKPTLLQALARSAKGGTNLIPGVGAHRLVMRAKGEPEILKLLEKLVK